MRAKIKMPTAAEERRINAGIAADPDTFALSDADLARMRHASEVLPPGVFAESTKPRRVRGPGKKPAKTLVTLRLDQAVLAGLRGLGAGWQVQAAAALKKLVSEHSKAPKDQR